MDQINSSINNIFSLYSCFGSLTFEEYIATIGWNVVTWKCKDSSVKGGVEDVRERMYHYDSWLFWNRAKLLQNKMMLIVVKSFCSLPFPNFQTSWSIYWFNQAPMSGFDCVASVCSSWWHDLTYVWTGCSLTTGSNPWEKELK